MVSAPLLKLLDPFNKSVTWETGRNDVAGGPDAQAVLGLSQTDERDPIRLRKEIGPVCHRSEFLNLARRQHIPVLVS
jgi:hypothetical protein